MGKNIILTKIISLIITVCFTVTSTPAYALRPQALGNAGNSQKQKASAPAIEIDWDWDNAASPEGVPWREIIDYPQVQPDGPVTMPPYGTKENQQRYWDNQREVRDEFLNLLREIDNIKIGTFLTRLSRINRILLIGRSGTSIYVTPTFEINVGDELQAIAGQLSSPRNDWAKPLLEKLQKFKAFALRSGEVSLMEVVQQIASFYHLAMSSSELRPTWIFRRGNQSLFMNMANGMLRLSGLNGIPFKDIGNYRNASEEKFNQYLTAAVQEANPGVDFNQTLADFRRARTISLQAEEKPIPASAKLKDTSVTAPRISPPKNALERLLGRAKNIFKVLVVVAAFTFPQIAAFKAQAETPQEKFDSMMSRNDYVTTEARVRDFEDFMPQEMQATFEEIAMAVAKYVPVQGSDFVLWQKALIIAETDGKPGATGWTVKVNGIKQNARGPTQMTPGHTDRMNRSFARIKEFAQKELKTGNREIMPEDRAVFELQIKIIFGVDVDWDKLAKDPEYKFEVDWERVADDTTMENKIYNIKVGIASLMDDFIYFANRKTVELPAKQVKRDKNGNEELYDIVKKEPQEEWGYNSLEAAIAAHNTGRDQVELAIRLKGNKWKEAEWISVKEKQVEQPKKGRKIKKTKPVFVSIKVAKPLIPTQTKIHNARFLEDYYWLSAKAEIDEAQRQIAREKAMQEEQERLKQEQVAAEEEALAQAQETAAEADVPLHITMWQGLAGVVAIWATSVTGFLLWLKSQTKKQREALLKAMQAAQQKAQQPQRKRTYQDLMRIVREYEAKQRGGEGPDSQIGKRAAVKEVIVRDTKIYLQLVDAKNEEESLGEIGLKPVGAERKDELIDALKKMILGTRTEDLDYLYIINEFLKLLQHSPPIYTYHEKIADFFGYASTEHDFIAIHEGLLGNPVSLFHEIAHYMAQQDPDKKNPQIIVAMEEFLDSAGMGFLDKHSQGYKNDRTHYVIRAFTRQVFEGPDIKLTQKIKILQEQQASTATIQAQLTAEEEQMLLAPVVENPKFRQDDYWTFIRLFKTWGLPLTDVVIVSAVEPAALYDNGILYLSAEAAFYEHDRSSVNFECFGYVMRNIIFRHYLSAYGGDYITAAYAADYLYEHQRQINMQGLEDEENILQFNSLAESVEKFLRQRGIGGGHTAENIADLVSRAQVWQDRLVITAENVRSALEASALISSDIAQRLIAKLQKADLVILNTDRDQHSLSKSLDYMLWDAIIALLGWDFDKADEILALAEAIAQRAQKNNKETAGLDSFEKDALKISAEVTHQWYIETQKQKKQKRTEAWAQVKITTNNIAKRISIGILSILLAIIPGDNPRPKAYQDKAPPAIQAPAIPPQGAQATTQNFRQRLEELAGATRRALQDEQDRQMAEAVRENRQWPQEQPVTEERIIPETRRHVVSEQTSQPARRVTATRQTRQPTQQEQTDTIKTTINTLLNSPRWENRFHAARALRQNNLTKISQSTVADIQEALREAHKKESDTRVKVAITNTLMHMNKQGALNSAYLPGKSHNVPAETLEQLLLENPIREVEEEMIIMLNTMRGYNLRDRLIDMVFSSQNARPIEILKNHFQDKDMVKAVVGKLAAKESVSSSIRDKIKEYIYDCLNKISTVGSREEIAANLRDIINAMSPLLQYEIVAGVKDLHTMAFAVFFDSARAGQGGLEGFEARGNIGQDARLHDGFVCNLVKYNKLTKIGSEDISDLYARRIAFDITRILLSGEQSIPKQVAEFFIPINDIFLNGSPIKPYLEQALLENFVNSTGTKRIAAAVFIAKNYKDFSPKNRQGAERIHSTVQGIIDRYNEESIYFGPSNIEKNKKMAVNLHYQNSAEARWYARNTLDALLAENASRYSDQLEAIEHDENTKSLKVEVDGIVYNLYIGEQKGIDTEADIRIVRAHAGYEMTALSPYGRAPAMKLNLLLGCFGTNKVAALQESFGKSWFVGTPGAGVSRFNDLITYHLPLILKTHIRNGQKVKWEQIKAQLKDAIEQELGRMQERDKETFEYIRGYYGDPFSAIDKFKFPHEMLSGAENLLSDTEIITSLEEALSSITGANFVSLNGAWQPEAFMSQAHLGQHTDASAEGIKPMPMDEEETLWLTNSRVYTSQQDAPVKVRLELGNHAFANGLKENIAQKIVDVASRKDLRDTIESGRSLVIPLEEENFLHFGDKTLRAIRLKPVTYNGQPPKMERYVVPPSERIAQPDSKIAFNSHTGTIRIEAQPEHPIGGGYLYEAMNEYFTMALALQSGIDTGYPLGVGQFIEMSFNGTKIGFVVIAVEDADIQRVGNKALTEIEAASDLPDKTHQQHIAKVRSLRRAYIDLNRHSKLIAKLLRGCMAKGIIHGHPHHDQFTVSKSGQVNIYDFTNADIARHMSRDEFIFRAFNDFRALYLNASSLATQGLPIATCRKFWKNIGLQKTAMQAVVEAYFTPEDIALVGRSRLERATGMEVMEHFFLTIWNKNYLEGKTIQQIDSDLIRIFEKIAGAEYDRLTEIDNIKPAPMEDLTPLQEVAGALTEERPAVPVIELNTAPVRIDLSETKRKAAEAIAAQA